MSSKIRLGTASPGTQATTAATIEQVSQLAQRAASQDIDLLLLPEAYIGGYPRGTSFGCIIGERTAEGREEYARYFEQAVDLGDTVGEKGEGGGEKWVKKQLSGDGDAVRGDGTREKLEQIANESGVFLVVGCIERAGGTLYCAAVYLCPKEGMIGKRRKVMPVSILQSYTFCLVTDLICRLAQSAFAGAKAPQARSKPSAPPSAASASTSPQPSAGKTTCRCCARRCTHKTSTSTSHPPPTAATPG
jgi:nitrilase